MNQDTPEPKHAVPDAALAVARLGHEINNLIQPLRANLHTLAAFWDGISPCLPNQSDHPAAAIHAAMPELLTEMHECLDRMAGMVRAAKTPPGAFQLPSQPLISPRTILADAHRAVRARAGQTELTMEMPATEPPAIRGDAMELTQVFINLILNAVTAAGATPTPRVTLTCRTSLAGQVELEVSDNGPGIAPEIANRLFQPFASTRQATGGTGLGLYICREIIRRHHGDIQAANGAHGGAVFTVTLPPGKKDLPLA